MIRLRLSGMKCLWIFTSIYPRSSTIALNELSVKHVLLGILASLAIASGKMIGSEWKIMIQNEVY
jgi:hypothetical protein